MIRRVSYLTLIVILLTMFCRCGSQDGQNHEGYAMEYPISKENHAVIDSCMDYMSSAPSKAHHMLDSILSAQIISSQRCDYLHAIVLFNGENNADSALCICNRLLDNADFGEDHFLEEEICDLASNITSSRSRYIETLRYAKRGIAICHGHELMRSDETAMMLRVGMAEQMMGYTKQAADTYNNVRALLAEDRSFGGLISLISLMKKQAALYFDAKDYDKAIATYHETLALVDKFDRDPSHVDPRPETMQTSGQGTHNFADFYNCQIYAKIATAYRIKVQEGASKDAASETDSVAHYIDLWSHTDGAKSTEGKVNALQDLYFLGRTAEFEEAKDAAASFFAKDSLVSEYVDYLSLLAEEAARCGNHKQSNSYLSRALVVSDSIRQHETLRMLSEQMSVNMVQEHDLARQDAESKVSRQRIIITLLCTLLGITLVAAFVIIRLVRNNRRKEKILVTAQKDLEGTKEEVKELTQKLEEAKTEKSAQSVQALYERIQQAMTERKLYLNADLDIKVLAEEIGSSRTLISVCINSMTGKPFRQWLSEYRLSLFDRLLKAHPSKPLEDLMRQCGYKDQSTFRRQFKAMYGMTAGEYRKQIAN